jgi:citrate lyase subunit beta/citryl-CoA lyase
MTANSVAVRRRLHVVRSLLFAPANRPDLVAKAPRSGPDAIVIDLEDAVPAAEKATTRALVPPATTALRDSCGQSSAILLRVNSTATEWFDADIANALCAEIDGVMVPKIESGEQVLRVRQALSAAHREDALIIGGIETAIGVHNVAELVRAGIDAVYFGAEDFIADMGGVRTSSSQEVLYARSRVALSARVAGIASIDQAVVAFTDAAAFRSDAADGRAIGYRGKICIHPAQVSVANEIFGHTAAEVKRARRIITAFEESSRRRAGVAVVDGKMVDEPIVRLARAVLADVADRD